MACKSAMKLVSRPVTQTQCFIDQTSGLVVTNIKKLIQIFKSGIQNVFIIPITAHAILGKYGDIYSISFFALMAPLIKKT